MDKQLWWSRYNNYNDGYIGVLDRMDMPPDYEAVPLAEPLTEDCQYVDFGEKWTRITSNKIGSTNNYPWLYIRKKKKNMASETSNLNDILRGAGTTIGVDLLVKTTTRKLAKMAIKHDRADLAAALISTEARDAVKTIAPATMLGIMVVLQDSEHKALKDFANSMIPPLKVAVGAGVASIGTNLIQHYLLSEEDELDELRMLIAESQEASGKVDGVSTKSAKVAQPAAVDIAKTL